MAERNAHAFRYEARPIRSWAAPEPIRGPPIQPAATEPMKGSEWLAYPS